CAHLPANYSSDAAQAPGTAGATLHATHRLINVARKSGAHGSGEPHVCDCILSVNPFASLEALCSAEIRQDEEEAAEDDKPLEVLAVSISRRDRHPRHSSSRLVRL